MGYTEFYLIFVPVEYSSPSGILAWPWGLRGWRMVFMNEGRIGVEGTENLRWEGLSSKRDQAFLFWMPGARWAPRRCGNPI